ncbi:MAG: alpha/beta hydrolase [Gammaproteobacteria bacterium]|nr:alpha/beta hydrolase [Gammaproteobacteria bacterium]
MSPPKKHQSVIIPGPSGELEALLSVPEDTTKETVAIICHPHPLHGGTMLNKVVHTIDKTLNNSGLVTIRFNFRGVGNSEGEYDDARGEIDDLRAVINWAAGEMPGYKLCLAGFSFGAYIAMKVSLMVSCVQLITVAPPVNILDFSPLQQPVCPWLLIQGAKDEIVDPAEVMEWAGQFSNVNIVSEPESGHFFHGKLNILQDIISTNYQA